MWGRVEAVWRPADGHRDHDKTYQQRHRYLEPSMATATYVERDRDVLHGAPYIVGTRVGVLDIVAALEAGLTVEAVATEFGISVDAVDAASAYAEDHPAEMERLRERRAEEVDELRARSRAGRD